MPAMPIAESSAPIVVGIRQTSRAIEHRDADGRAPRSAAIGLSASTTTTKTIDRLASRMFSAISFGVFCRARALDERDHPVDEGLARLRA